MRFFAFAAMLLVFSGLPHVSVAQSLSPQTIGDVSFLIGSWSNGNGVVADTGQTSHGTSIVTSELGGRALLRRDHTDLTSKDGAAAGGFDQIMLIYTEAGSLRADYDDGTHVIHYTSATVVPGISVAFLSATTPSAPTYRLTYEATTSNVLTVRFEIAAPGSAAFHPIATGSLTRT